MTYFISMITSFITSLFTVELFDYFLAGLAFISVSIIVWKIVTG